MTERTVRDRYAEIRGKLLEASIHSPDLFNGFGHLLLDEDGTINAHVLEALALISQTPEFEKRMARRYPKYREATGPTLNHVVE